MSKDVKANRRKDHRHDSGDKDESDHVIHKSVTIETTQDY